MSNHTIRYKDEKPEKVSWQEDLHAAIYEMLHSSVIYNTISDDHIAATPERVVKAFQEYFSGCADDPERVLRGGFEKGDYDQIIFVRDISFVSMCAHHLAPIFGKVDFAYLPKDHNRIVGLSKIPRMIEIYARRPQVQEKFTHEIVDTFNRVVKPRGCGAVVSAYHFCMIGRGVRKEQAFTTTTALKGIFKMSPTVRNEFLSGVTREVRWP